MKRNMMDGLNRWNQKDKQGMLLSGMAVLFGFLLPALVYGVSYFMAVKSTVDSNLALIYQIREILVVLSFTAFYSALFTSVLNRIPFWKNLLCLLAPFLTQSGYLLIVNWRVLAATPETDINATANKLLLLMDVLAYLITPLLWLAIAYVVRFIPWGKKWNHVMLMILMTLWRTLPDLISSKQLAPSYYQSQGAFIFLTVMVGAMVFFIGFKLFSMVDKELNAPSGEDWAHQTQK